MNFEDYFGMIFMIIFIVIPMVYSLYMVHEYFKEDK